MLKKFLTKLGMFFCEANGNPSSMRLMSYTCVVAGIILCFKGSGTIGLGLVTLGLTGKTVQKYKE